MEDLKIKALAEAIKVYFKNDCNGYSPLNAARVDVSFEKDDTRCTVHLQKMHEGIGDWVNFERLTWLSKLLNTEKINLGRNHYTPGCDTCDHGSKDEIDIVCDNINP